MCMHKVFHFTPSGPAVNMCLRNIVILFGVLAVASCSRFRRLEKRLRILEDKVQHELSDRSSSFTDLFQDNVNTMRTGFAEEKKYIRTHVLQVDEKLERVKRDFESNLQAFQSNVELLRTDVKNGFQAVNEVITKSSKSTLRSCTAMNTTTSTIVKAMEQTKKNLREMNNTNNLIAEAVRELHAEIKVQTDKEETCEEKRKIDLTMFGIGIVNINAVHSFGSSVYFVGSEKLKWFEALQICKSIGAHLPEVTSSRKEDFLNQLGLGDLWLGASDLDQEGTWIWESSKQLLGAGSYSNWWSDQPDNYKDNENCLQLYLGAWNDYPCNLYNRYVCEMVIVEYATATTTSTTTSDDYDNY